MVDNQTAVAVINHMGSSHSMDNNHMAREIWLWCMTNHTWLSAVHVPGSHNVDADLQSRSVDFSMECQTWTGAIHSAIQA